MDLSELPWCIIIIIIIIIIAILHLFLPHQADQVSGRHWTSQSHKETPFLEMHWQVWQSGAVQAGQLLAPEASRLRALQPSAVAPRLLPLGQQWRGPTAARQLS